MRNPEQEREELVPMSLFKGRIMTLAREVAELRRDKERLVEVLRTLVMRSGNKSSAEFGEWECPHGTRWTDPCEYCGGGAVDLASIDSVMEKKA